MNNFNVRIENEILKCIAGINWVMAVLMMISLTAQIYVPYLALTFRIKALSFLWGKFCIYKWKRILNDNKFLSLGFIVYLFIVIGILAAHKYCSHKTFKASRGFHIFLIICQTITGQVKFVKFISSLKYLKNLI